MSDTNPMPATVRMNGQGILIYECPPCQEASHYPKNQHAGHGGFMALYELLQERAWEHNLGKHCKQAVEPRQLDIFDALAAS